MLSNLSTLRSDMESCLGKRLLLFFAKTAHRLPNRAMLAVGRGFGWLVPRVASRRLDSIRIAIAEAFDEPVTSPFVRKVAYGYYRHMGESVMEFLRLPHMSADNVRRWVTLEGVEHIEAALARGKGAIMLTAHIGNWELCGTMMGLSGYPTTAIARTQADSVVTDLFTRIREAHGLKVVPATDVRECIRVLKRNECLGILGDLNASPPTAFVQFLGRPAATYLGTAYLAQFSGAEILPLFDERRPDGTHCVRISAPIRQSQTGDRLRDQMITTMRVQEVIEQEIRRRPAEWFWAIQRWKTCPEEVANPERIPMEHRDFTPDESARLRAGHNDATPTC